jgi:hydroxyethylthiazole kinase-like uncharacterized protein yjeF
LSAPGPEDHKYSRGKVVIVSGAMPGAAMLSAGGAQRSGAGYVTVAGSRAHIPPFALVHVAWDAQSLNDPRIGAVVIGPGLGLDAEAADRLEVAIASDRPLVIDADALTLLARAGGAARLRDRAAPSVLTPHEGEFARLCGTRGGERGDRLRSAAAVSGAIVLLKGSRTMVATPSGEMAIGDAASAWLATAGTGDVLSGIMGTMVAQRRAHGTDMFTAAQAAVWLHGDAARRAGPVLIADDLVGHLPAAVAACL